MNEKLEIRSLDQAERMITSVSEEREQEVVLYQCVDSILKEGNTQVIGSADSFHNVAVACVKIAEDYLSACEIVEKGITIHPSNTDLLADAIKYGYKCGNRELCEKYLSVLNEIDKRCWTWRAFSFVIDYIVEFYVSDNGMTELLHTEEELDALVEQYKKRYPDNEDSYFSEYEIYNRFGDKERAFDVLKKAMENINFCPKCWLRYADEMVDLGLFSEAVKPVMKLCNASNASDSVNMSYVYYLRGICQIELLNVGSDNSEEDIFGEIEYDLEKVELVYKSFYKALQSKDIYGNVRDKCWTRIREWAIRTNTECPAYLESMVGCEQ